MLAIRNIKYSTCKNLPEHNLLLDGRSIPGPLADFALLMYHVGPALAAAGAGPFFYLSKLEGSSEAALWDQVSFTSPLLVCSALPC